MADYPRKSVSHFAAQSTFKAPSALYPPAPLRRLILGKDRCGQQPVEAVVDDGRDGSDHSAVDSGAK